MIKYLLILVSLLAFSCSDSVDSPTTTLEVLPIVEGKIEVNIYHTVDGLYLVENVGDEFVKVDSSNITNKNYQFSYGLSPEKKYRIVVSEKIDGGLYYYVEIDKDSTFKSLNFPEDFTQIIEEIDIDTTIDTVETVDKDTIPKVDTTDVDTATNPLDSNETKIDSTDIKEDNPIVDADPIAGKRLIPGGKVALEYTSPLSVETVVSVSPFYMDSVNVTVEEYYSLIDTTGIVYAEGTNNGLHAPINNVSWMEAILYCNAKSKEAGLDTVYTYNYITNIQGQLDVVNVKTKYDAYGYRLPTLAEMSFTAKGGATTTYPWGNDSLDASSYGWFIENSELLNNDVCEDVGTKLPNQYGIYDLIGNGSEFCNDFFSYSEGFAKLYGSVDGELLDPRGTENNQDSDIMIYGVMATSTQSVNFYNKAMNMHKFGKGPKRTFRTVLQVKK